MNAKEIRLARHFLGLNQTAFAELLGWTSKRNVVNLERGDKEVMTQTALAIECLLRKNNKFGEFEMLNKMQPVLEWVISEINRVNKERESGTVIADDETNEELASIFHRTANKFAEIDFELEDDEEILINLFGYAGFCSIREAERDQG